MSFMEGTQSRARGMLLDGLAAELAAVPGQPFVRACVDGVDGAGKTVFADELAAALVARGQAVVRASVDGFHQPRALRYLRGRHDPEGFYRDSYDLAALRRKLLDPFRPGGDGRYQTRVFDVATDKADRAEQAQASPGTVLLVDGIFLHRPELRQYWDWSLWLQVDRGISLQRCVARDGGGSADLAAPSNRRYVLGQQLYITEASPQQHATHVVDNNDLVEPTLIRQPGVNDS